MFHFSLRALAGAITAIALACAALIYASPWTASLAWTVTVLGLALATVAAVLSTSHRRGFWTGFAIVGWLYAFVTVSPMLGQLQGSLFTTALMQLAAKAMPAPKSSPGTPGSLHSYGTPTTSYVVGPAITASTPVYASGSPTSMPTQLGFGLEDGSGAAPSTSSRPTYSPAPAPVPLPPAAIYPVTTYTPSAIAASRFAESFIEIGQALWVLAFAMVGGLMGQCLVARQSRAEPSASK
jgi:hypothetical protein